MKRTNWVFLAHQGHLPVLWHIVVNSDTMAGKPQIPEIVQNADNTTAFVNFHTFLEDSAAKQYVGLIQDWSEDADIQVNVVNLDK